MELIVLILMFAFVWWICAVIWGVVSGSSASPTDRVNSQLRDITRQAGENYRRASEDYLNDMRRYGK